MKKLISANSKIELKTPARILAKWQPRAETESGEDGTITIYDVIDSDWGVGARRIDAALRAIGADNPVTVKINSAGGDLTEGIAIYNLLLEHRGKVTIKVIGMAASAASIIVMAGDEVQILRGASLMVHNCWSFAIGNKHDMAEAHKVLGFYDEQMKSIYNTRFNGTDEELTKLLDDETFIDGKTAVDLGLADIASDEEPNGDLTPDVAALKTVEYALQASGLSRSERRELIKALTTKPGAGGEEDTKPRASEYEETAAIAATLKNIFK